MVLPFDDLFRVTLFETQVISLGLDVDGLQQERFDCSSLRDSAKGRLV